MAKKKRKKKKVKRKIKKAKNLKVEKEKIVEGMDILKASIND